MIKTNGQIAYEAFDKAHPAAGMDWDAIPPPHQAAWEAAAVAVLISPEGPKMVRVEGNEYERLLIVERKGLKALDRVQVLEAQREALLNCLVSR